MNATGADCTDASPVSMITANARTAHADSAELWQDHKAHAALDIVSRQSFDGSSADERARALPRQTWTIVAVGLVAWVVVAIPAWIIFG